MAYHGEKFGYALGQAGQCLTKAVDMCATNFSKAATVYGQTRFHLNLSSDPVTALQELGQMGTDFLRQIGWLTINMMHIDKFLPHFNPEHFIVTGVGLALTAIGINYLLKSRHNRKFEQKIGGQLSKVLEW